MAGGHMKREPEAFSGHGPGGTHHRYETLSKADWADAFADLYRQAFGEMVTAEEILADAEHRDDLRRMQTGQAKVRRPVKQEGHKAELKHKLEAARNRKRAAFHGGEARRAEWEAACDEVATLEAEWKAVGYGKLPSC